MSDQKKYQRPKPVVTPVCLFKFPYLDKPDTSKFALERCDDGQFKVTALFKNGDKQWAALEKSLEPLYAEGVKQFEIEKKEAIKKGLKGAKVPVLYPRNDIFKPDADKSGEETGFTAVTFKTGASYTMKDGTAVMRKLVLVDAQRQNIPKGTAIWGGSSGKISFEPGFYNTKVAGSGISLRLIGAQVLNLVSGGGGHTADSAGFGDEEGYTADTDTSGAGDATASSKVGKSDDEEDDTPF